MSCNQEMEMLAILDSIAALMELDQEVEEGEVSLFLTTVVGLIKNSSMVRVRVAAYVALEASGKHVACNMARQRERDYVMQVLGCIKQQQEKYDPQLLCEGSQSEDEEESGAALSCLVNNHPHHRQHCPYHCHLHHHHN